MSQQVQQQPLPAQAPTQPQAQAQLLSIPSEIVLSVLYYLDIPDLYALTKTCALLRQTATDPLLHRQRLQSAKQHLAHTLPGRPVAPPPPPLFLTQQQATQRLLSRKLTKISLRWKLAIRPDVHALVVRGVMPAEIVSGVAPALVGKAHQLEKERVKDVLRGCVGQRGSLEDVAEREGWDWVRPADVEEERWPRVGELTRRWEDVRKWETRRGSGRCVKWDPPRAKVLGLRRFYEMLSKG